MILAQISPMTSMTKLIQHLFILLKQQGNPRLHCPILFFIGCLMLSVSRLYIVG
jgi:hypothetical protein